jgi:hypothetical protein
MTTTVFVSWSGERSKIVASSLSRWLQDVFQDLKTWMSAHNIDAGQRWGNELGQQLADTSFGILCLTPENLNSSWLLFEAGALSKVIGEAKVVPYLFQLSTTDVPYPLAQFQSVEATRAGSMDLVRSINASLERPIAAERLERLFDKWWQDLENGLDSVPIELQGTPAQHRSERALLEEVLQTVRSLSRAGAAAPTPTATSPDVDVWRGIHVWNLQQRDMEALTLDELQEYRNQAYAASMVAHPQGKEDAIDAKVAMADQELARKRKGT